VAGGEYSAKYNAQLAASSATAAAGSATSASASAASAIRYIGPSASNPTTRNDGTAIQAGDTYFNTVAGEMRVYTGSIWQAQAASPDTISERNFVATAGQTSYTFTGGYRIGYLYPYVNGVLLDPTDYTAADGTTITFATALAAGDEVRLITFKAIGSVAVSDISGLQAALDSKQATLVSGTNIKTVAGQSVLGSGDITIAAGAQDFLLMAQGVI